MKANRLLHFVPFGNVLAFLWEASTLALLTLCALFVCLDQTDVPARVYDTASSIQLDSSCFFSRSGIHTPDGGHFIFLVFLTSVFAR